MFYRNREGERRLSPPWYRALLAAHIIVSVGWLGVVLAKLVLGIAAVTTNAPDVADALFVSMEVINGAFPPLAIGTIVTGVLQSLGTKWGLLQHYWVVTKLTLSVAVIVTAVQIGGRIAQHVFATPPGPAVNNGTIVDLAAAPTMLLVSLSVVHVLMLGVATVVSVYKPWGKTWFSRRTVRVPQEVK